MRSRTPDRLCAEAVELARQAAVEAVGAAAVGTHLAARAEGERVVTHTFECLDAAYRGWHWAVTVARAPRAKVVTLDEVVLLPGTDAVLAPQWVPWSERLRPGDLGPGDLLPTDADDERLEPGWTGEDEPAPNSAVFDGEEELELSDPHVQPAPVRAQIGAVADELGMARPRVLSRLGMHLAADRWEKAHGPQTPMAQSAPASCTSCGFLIPIGGSLGQAFGVCGNEYGPADGQIVSLAYGCGGHSEAAVLPAPPVPAELILDETVVEPLHLHPDRSGGSVEPDAPAEELGHS
ncbi:hypothetical protein ABH930_003416 [Kitasatospora sp. GAS204A]|uniref:DUF3027 domain-containing protein n=1 Tax=unclassified Kitasatospora TaxID=2633591 RepID=UPI00247505C4|nr:DUF3027 domain-containing protein [Kitasatospora sp. GAS204B]MDH6118177.1 hypothetical protein [Kitasatospora sp. GAS204B]